MERSSPTLNSGRSSTVSSWRGGFEGRGRAHIFRLAWDFVGSALASRNELYERFYLARARAIISWRMCSRTKRPRAAPGRLASSEHHQRRLTSTSFWKDGKLISPGRFADERGKIQTNKLVPRTPCQSRKSILIRRQSPKGTQAGELLRRYWHPIAVANEVKDVPMAVRVLGEDLILFKTPRGQVGLADPAALIAALPCTTARSKTAVSDVAITDGSSAPMASASINLVSLMAATSAIIIANPGIPLPNATACSSLTWAA